MADTVTLAELGKRLEALALKNVPLEPVLKQCLVAMQAETKQRFVTSTAPDGSGWAPLKMRQGKPLWDTGQLMLSCTAGKHVDAVRRIEKDGLEFGTMHEFADVHQSGREIRPVKAGALAIPMTKQATKSGGPRNFPVPLMVKGRFLGEEKGKGKRSRFVAHFAFAQKSVIPPRPFIGWNEKLLQTLEEIIADYAIKKLEGK